MLLYVHYQVKHQQVISVAHFSHSMKYILSQCDCHTYISITTGAGLSALLIP